MRYLLLVYTLFFSALLIWTDSSLARDKGWVPLKDNNASSLNIPFKSVVPDKGKTRRASTKENSPVPVSRSNTVYANQPPVTEKEVSSFIEILPRFRIWARKNGEEAHPVVSINGQPDFLYSDNAAKWIASQNFDPPRFFCIMGRLAAGLVIVEEGNDYKGTRPADMPPVDPQEVRLVRKHLGELLAVSGPPGPIRSE